MSEVSSIQRRRLHLEVVLGSTFVLLACVFLVEVLHYAGTGEWVLVGGLGAFARWPVERALHLDIGLHSIGMLVWMAIVIHQLFTRGAGLHPWIGRFGALLLFVALALAWRPAVSSGMPALHGALGLTMQDLTLVVAGIGIAEELAIGVYKVRRGDVESHRKHLLVSVMFTAAPALYRAGVYILTAIFDLRDPQASVWETAWVHELSQCFVLLTAMATLLTPWLGAHLAVLRRPLEHDAVERTAARAMAVLSAVMITVYSLWAVDLLLMWGDGQRLLQRTDVPLFILYFAGLG